MDKYVEISKTRDTENGIKALAVDVEKQHLFSSNLTMWFVEENTCNWLYCPFHVYVVNIGAI